MENIKRRTEKEKQDIHQFGTEKVMLDLLPALDSMEKALVAEGDTKEGASDDDASIMAGLQLVYKQMCTALERHGLKAVESVGQSFDPNLHQAIQRIEEDVKEETVKEEFVRGYTLNGRLLRAAMVSVSVPK